MKLHQLTEVRYAGSLEAEDVLSGAVNAADATSRVVGNRQRHLYHLNQMIKLAADIKIAK